MNDPGTTGGRRLGFAAVESVGGGPNLWVIEYWAGVWAARLGTAHRVRTRATRRMETPLGNLRPGIEWCWIIGESVNVVVIP